MRDCKAIIEFGTSKITCTVAERRARMGLEVLGCAQVGYSGIKKANWVDNNEVYYALEQVLESVERIVGFRIRNVEVGIPGAFLKVVSRRAQVVTKGRVSERDIQNLMEKAGEFDAEEDLTLVHDWPAWFLMDDGSVFLDPLGIPTRRLRGCVTFILANRFFLNDVVDLLKHLGVRVDNFIPEPLAEALYLIPQDKRDDIAVLLDVGYYSTNIAVAYGDALIYFNCVPMGGGSVTADLAYVMKVDLETAEQLKRQYSLGLKDDNGVTHMYAKSQDGRLKRYPYELVSEVIEARVEHIITYAMRLIARTEKEMGRRLDVYVTGGGICFMRGIGSFYQAVAGRPLVPIKTNNIKLQPPNLHAAYAMTQFSYESDVVVKPKPKKRGFFGQLEDEGF